MNRSMLPETDEPRAQIEQILNDLIRGFSVPIRQSHPRGERRERNYSNPQSSRPMAESRECATACGVRGCQADPEN